MKKKLLKVRWLLYKYDINSKLVKNRNTDRQKTSFAKQKVENADLDKPVVKKKMITDK